MRHYFCTTEKCTTERTTERPNVRPNDRNVRPNDQKRTTERPQYVRPNGHVNVRTYDQLKTHIECFLFGKTCCDSVSGFFFFNLLVGHSMRKLTLTATVRSECRLSYRTSLHKSMCLAPQRSGLSHFDPS